MARKVQHTTTIQTWPGGQSYEFRGDPEGPENQRSLRDGHYQSRLRCSAYCRRLLLDMVEDSNTEDPRLGRYISAEGDDWTKNDLCPTCKGEGYINNPKRNPWRKGTAEEWRRIRHSQRAENFASRDVYACDSALVDDLIKAASSGALNHDARDLGEGFSYDEIRNIYADPSDWSAAQCREYAEDYGIELPDVPTVECPVCHGEPLPDGPNVPTTTCGNCTGKGEIPEDGYEDDDNPRGWLTEARETCREYAQDNPAEVYEWWRVSSWLCEKLHEIGEVTIDNNYGYWWGRCTTGQGFLMDGVLQRVAALLDRED